MYLFVTNLKGISSMRLHRELDISQKSAWHVGHRIRHAIYYLSGKMAGPVEIDEAFFGGREKWRHRDKRKNIGTGSTGKAILIGMVDQTTNETRVFQTESRDYKVVEPLISKNVYTGAKVYTDEGKCYQRVKSAFKHKKIKHAVGQYAVEDGDDTVTVNSVESRWTMLKRAYHGTFHKMSISTLSGTLKKWQEGTTSGNWIRRTRYGKSSDCRLVFIFLLGPDRRQWTG